MIETAPEPIAASAERPSRLRWWVILAAASLVCSGVGLTAWRWHSQVIRVQQGVPVLPDLRGKPEKLGELLKSAHSLATGRKGALKGVAELGRLYHANGYRKEAEACWNLLGSVDPKNPQWTYFLADIRKSASDFESMADLLRLTVKLAPDYLPAWLQLAAWELKNGRLDAAENYYLQRLNRLPSDPYARFGLARVALQRGRKDDGRRLIEQLVRESPEFPPGHSFYAEMLAADGDVAGARQQRWLAREAGRFRDADDPWLQGLVPWCYDPKRLYVLATVDYQTSQSDHGVSLFQKAIELAPEDPDGYEQLGDLYLKLGKAEKARDTLEEGRRRYVGATPRAMLYVNLNQAYRMLKLPDEALRVAQEGIARTGGAFEIYDALGVTLGDLDRHADAIAAFKTALSDNPNDPNTNYNLSISLLALRRHEEAYLTLKRALTLQPTFPNALVMLGRMDLEAGRLTEAETFIRALYESQPGVPQARQLLGAWHMRSGLFAEKRNDFAAAERHYRAGLEVDPDEPELYVSLGVLCLVQGRIAEALSPLEAYRGLRPNESRGALYLGQVYARLGRLPEARSVLADGVQLAEKNGNADTAKFCREILLQLN